MHICFLKYRPLIRAGTKSGIKQWAILFFLFQAIIQFCLQCIFTTYLYLAPDQLPSELKKQSTTVFVYNLLDMLPILFQMLNVLESIVSSNTIQLMAVNFLNLGPIATWTSLSSPSLHCFTCTPQLNCDYFLFEFFIFSSILSAVCIIVTFCISLKLRRLYNWTIYKHVGADKQVLGRIQNFFFLTMMVRLDNFLYFFFNLQYFFVLLISNFSRWCLLFQLFVTFLFLGFSIALCMKALRQHNKRYMVAFITCHILRLFYAGVLLHLLLSRSTTFIQGKHIAIVSLALCITSSVISVIYAIKFIYYFDPDLSWKVAYSSMISSENAFHHTLGP